MNTTQTRILSLSVLVGTSLLAAQPTQAASFSYITLSNATASTIHDPSNPNGSYFDVKLGTGSNLNPVPFTTISPLNILPELGNGTDSYIAPVNATLTIAITDGADTGDFYVTGTFGGGDINSGQDTATFSNLSFSGSTNLTLNGDNYVVYDLQSSDPEQPGGNYGAISFRISTVPEPGAWAMLAAVSITGLGLLSRRRRK